MNETRFNSGLRHLDGSITRRRRGVFFAAMSSASMFKTPKLLIFTFTRFQDPSDPES